MIRFTFLLLAATLAGCQSACRCGFDADALMLRANIPTYDHTMAVLAVAHGASMDHHPQYGSWVLFAAEKGNNELLDLLLRHGGDPNPDISKELVRKTPLHWAVYGRDVKAIELLMYWGANPDALDGDGQKATDYTFAKDDEAVRRMLSRF